MRNKILKILERNRKKEERRIKFFEGGYVRKVKGERKEKGIEKKRWIK